MSECYRLAVDPYILSLPNPCISEEQIDEFVDGLLGWSCSLRRQDMHILVSDRARIALMEDGEYPEQHRLREALRRLQYVAADYDTVCSLVQNILNTTPSLEETLGFEDILLDESKIIINPGFLIERLNENTKKAFVEMLAMMALARVVVDPDINKNLFVSSAKRNANICEKLDVVIESEIHECSFTGEKNCPAFPIIVQDQIPFAWGYSDLIKQLGVHTIWKNATCADDAVEAIEQCIRELLRSGLDESRRHSFRIGTRFLNSARQWGFFNRTDYAMLLIESCARIVLDVPKNSIKTFRVSSTSTEQRVRADGARAFRTHLTKTGPGFRLMLWRLVDDTIEFANVGDKDELEIL